MSEGLYGKETLAHQRLLVIMGRGGLVMLAILKTLAAILYWPLTLLAATLPFGSSSH
jgi:hypothetical protein